MSKSVQTSGVPAIAPGPSPSALSDDPRWYKDAVIYQIHVRGFFDSNDDGVGDFEGLTRKLDYIQALGVSAIWLQPFYPSPLRDDGYDIAHYQGVHPSYGTPRDFTRFLGEAHRRGLRVITELVINHTSDQHPWFQAARRAKPSSSKRNFYVWNDTPDKYADVPIVFKDTERSNWTWDPVANAYFWHRFFHHQPDLNFDNPKVQAAVKRVMRYWLDLGVDGMRLDAVPYLVEREGTQCANLPETHAILKDIRRELDAHYKNRMLLAEANQWPSDVRAYFGDDDECHMAFHFPLMPRLYMALRQEDRHPLSQILWQMPEIPEGCQWALFLRNHDELTLEMVSDEERDYLYKTYAADPQMRLNVGIRRRLAPLMENSRPQIELMHGLLLSLPGTPVLYYGDEIGMGDNVYLGDRNGVRTPMQWSADRNGGFSRSDPARLYAPPIMDPVYGFQSVNVESQERSPHSLLQWMRRLITLRQRYPAFGRGAMDLLRPTNRHVFAFIRRYNNEDPILVVANLSRTVQGVSLDLSSLAGLVPVEMMGGVDLPRITAAPYFLTLGPHGFMWLLLRHEAPSLIDARLQPPAPEPEPEQMPLLVGPEWHTLLDGSVRHLLERQHLPAFLKRQPWFPCPSPSLSKVTIADWSVIDAGPEPVVLVIVSADFEQGIRNSYALPLMASNEEHGAEIARQSPEMVVARLAGARRGVLHGRLDGPAGRALVSAIMRENRLTMRRGTLTGIKLPDFERLGLPPLIQDLQSAPFDFDTRHSSAAFGERIVLKCERRLWPGPSPEAHVAAVLQAPDDPFPYVPLVGGLLEYRGVDGVTNPIARMEAYVPHQRDGWRQALMELARFLEAPEIADAPPALSLGRWMGGPPPEGPQRTDGFLPIVRTIGQRTAELHLALRRSRVEVSGAAAAPEEHDPRALAAALSRNWDDVRAYLATQARTDGRVAELAVRLQAAGPAIVDRIEHLSRQLDRVVEPIPIHGRLELPRMLIHEGEITFIDPASDPNIPPAERLRPCSPLVDLASVLWSISVAARLAAEKRSATMPPPHDRLFGWARTWAAWMGSSFLSSYRSHAGTLVPDDSSALLHELTLRVLATGFRDVEACAGRGAARVALSLATALDVFDEREN
ncbi:MAG: maltose alpha-D-glucosyltransferase [Acidobacteriota bacterium]